MVNLLSEATQIQYLHSIQRVECEFCQWPADFLDVAGGRPHPNPPECLAQTLVSLVLHVSLGKMSHALSACWPLCYQSETPQDSLRIEPILPHGHMYSVKEFLCSYPLNIVVHLVLDWLDWLLPEGFSPNCTVFSQSLIHVDDVSLHQGFILISSLGSHLCLGVCMVLLTRWLGRISEQPMTCWIAPWLGWSIIFGGCILLKGHENPEIYTSLWPSFPSASLYNAENHQPLPNCPVMCLSAHLSCPWGQKLTSCWSLSLPSVLSETPGSQGLLALVRVN